MQRWFSFVGAGACAGIVAMAACTTGDAPGELAPAHRIFLVSPTTVASRVARIAAAAHGFVYYVSFAGITGADRLALDDVAARVAALKRATSVPVAVGFGVRDAQSAGALAVFADAVVIGSALVEALAASADAPAAAGRFLAPVRAAMDAARRGAGGAA